MATPQEILDELKNVKYPGYSRDIVSFGMVRNIQVASDGITVVLAPGGAREDAVAQIKEAIIGCVRGMTGVDRVEVVVQRDQETGAARANAGPSQIEGVGHVIAVASGKGGVGKSTVAVNLALALHSLGQRVGLLDADVYGPSIPQMLGLKERPDDTKDDRLHPLEKFGIKVISFGLFITEGQPVIWRGPLVTKLLTQFLHGVDWGELDFLLIDLPPGTGDAQLTIAQKVPLSGGLIVTTPQDVALVDVQRAITMFHEVKVPVIGIVENMSYYTCSGCGHRAEIFGHGGGAERAQEFGIPFLGEIPLVSAIRETGDSGEPIVVADVGSQPSEAFREIARRVRAGVKAQRPASLPMIH